MKPVWLVIGRNQSMEHKFSGKDHETIFFESVVPSVNYLKVSTLAEVVIYVASCDADSSRKAVGYIVNSLPKKFRLYVIAQNSDQADALFINGVDDVFPEEVTASIIRERLNILRSSQKGNEVAEVNVRHYRIPFWKRVFDIFFASVALFLLSPLLLIIMTAIRIESKGPVIYTSKRVGTGYKVFGFLKFRSMFLNSDSRVNTLMSKNQYMSEEENVSGTDEDALYSDSPVLYGDNQAITEMEYNIAKQKAINEAFFKMVNDPRITKVGRIIRKLSIDELPQLINILKGDMSVVGNRPLPLYEAEKLTSDEWVTRFLGPAGLTGLWQVTKRGGANSLSPEERKMLDVRYTRELSFIGDISIIIRTFFTFIQHENV